MEDLESGFLSLKESEVSVDDAWEYYSQLPAFENLVVFDQFKTQLTAHRAQLAKTKTKSQDQMKAMQHDRALHPRKTRNKRGELVFDLHPAKALLQADMKNKKHEGMTPSALQKTRPEYLEFSKEKFKERIYQEIRRQKYFYYLNHKREKKLESARKAKEQAAEERTNLVKQREEARAKESHARAAAAAKGSL